MKNYLLLAILVMSGCSSYNYDYRHAIEQAVEIGGVDVIKIEPVQDIPNQKLITIASTYFDFGYEWGLMAKEALIPMNKIGSADQELNNGIIRFYEQNYPEHLEKVKGVAKAYGIKFEELDMRYMERDFFINSGWVLFNYGSAKPASFPLKGAACSIVAYQTDKGMLYGRNFDYNNNWPRFIMINKLRGIYQSVGNTILAPGHWIMDGVNEKGLAIGVMTIGYPEDYAKLGNQKYPSTPSVNAHHMMQIVIDKCATVDEAAAMVGKMNIWFSDEYLHFLVADRGGNAAVFEFDKEGKLVVVKKEKKYLLSTNNYLSENKDIPFYCDRYRTGDLVLRNIPVDSLDSLYNNVMILMSVPKICRPNLATIWTSLFDLSTSKMDVRFMEEDYKTSHFFSAKPE